MAGLSLNQEQIKLNSENISEVLAKKEIGYTQETLKNLQGDIDIKEEITKDLQSEKKEIIGNMTNDQIAKALELNFKNGDKWIERKKIDKGAGYTFLVQAALDKLGYTKQLGNEKVDGRYGPDTKVAVLKFQQDKKLEGQEGLAGQETLSKMYELLTTNTEAATTNTEAATTNTEAATTNTEAATTNTEAATTNTEIDKIKISKLAQEALMLGGIDSLPQNTWDNLTEDEKNYLTDAFNKYIDIGEEISKESKDMVDDGIGFLSNYKDREKIMVYAKGLGIPCKPNPRLDAYVLYKAMKGAGTDNEIINKLLESRIKEIEDNKLTKIYLGKVSKAFDELSKDLSLLEYLKDDDLGLYRKYKEDIIKSSYRIS